jgi:hypothetical protein
MIVSSSGEALGPSAGVGISVCARVVADSAKIDNAIHSPITFLVNVILSEVKNL